MKKIKTQILEVANKKTVFRAGDLMDVIDPRSTINRMVAKGELIRVDRGLYSLPNPEITQYHSFVEVAKMFPGGNICLISALFFHGIGTQMPYETWIMRRDHRSIKNLEYPIRVFYSSGIMFNYGVRMHIIEGTEIGIYSPAKTIADCFKFRNKVGLDVAIEALKEGWRAKLFTMDELWEASKVCRVQKVIQPYIEMLVL